MRCAPCAGATPPRCSSGSTRSSGAGPPTTGHRYPPRPSASWITTCGDFAWKWAKISHSTKPAYWVFARYFGTFNKARQDRWVFGDPRRRQLPPPLRLDQHRPTPDRQARGVARRPRACRLLGLATTESAPADQPRRDAAVPSPGRTLRDLQDHAARRLRPPRHPTRLGALAGHHSQDDRRRLEHSHTGRRCTTNLVHLHCHHHRQPPRLA